MTNELPTKPPPRTRWISLASALTWLAFEHAFELPDLIATAKARRWSEDELREKLTFEWVKLCAAACGDRLKDDTVRGARKFDRVLKFVRVFSFSFRWPAVQPDPVPAGAGGPLSHCTRWWQSKPPLQDLDVLRLKTKRPLLEREILVEILPSAFVVLHVARLRPSLGSFLVVDQISAPDDRLQQRTFTTARPLPKTAAECEWESVNRKDRRITNPADVAKISEFLRTKRSLVAVITAGAYSH